MTGHGPQRGSIGTPRRDLLGYSQRHPVLRRRTARSRTSASTSCKGEIRAIIGPERGRQDVDAERASTASIIRRKVDDHLQGQGTCAGMKPPHVAAVSTGHRPDVPERRALQGHDHPGQHHDRAQSLKMKHQTCSGIDAGTTAGPRTRKIRAPREFVEEDHRLPGDQAIRRTPGRPVALRPAEAGRTRPGAGRWNRSCCCSTSRWPA